VNSLSVIQENEIGRWEGHVVRARDRRGVNRILVGKPEGTRPLGRPRHRWEHNMMTDLQGVGYYRYELGRAASG